MSDIIETRSRSRSKTPGLLSNENGDAKGAKKVPSVSLIEEEEDVIEVSSQPSQRPKRQRRSAKNVQSDTSGETQIETVVSNSKQSKSTVTATTTTTIVQTTKQTINGTDEKNSEESTSVKTTNYTTSNNEAASEIPESQSIFNNIFNAIKTSTPILSTKRTKRTTTYESSSPTANVDFNLHPAYKEYKEAGEYWNKFPKTDYTYSELSPHRRELGAGIVAMPNMSRKSLDKYQNRIEAMIQQNPSEESFIRRKFLSNMSYQKKSADLQYDSADEVDVSDLYRNLSARRNSQKNVFFRFVTFIVTVFSSSYSNLKRRITYGSKQHLSYTPMKRHHNQGFLRSIYNFIQRFVLLCVSKVYLFISTILCLDTWLLYTRSENVQQNQKRKRFLIGLLIVFPLMLFGGTYIYLDPPQNISFPQISLPQFPKISFPKIAFPSITIPKISFDFIKWPEFSLPSWPEWLKFPEISMPSISFPSISMPQVSFDFLKFSLPEFSWPEWLKFPEFSFSWPSFSLPSWFRLPSFSFYLPELSFSWPEISFAWLKMPEFSFELPAWFKWPEFNFSLPSISFDFLNPVINYTSDAFGSIKSTSVEFLDKIRGVTMGLLNEIQIVWNENFNIK